MSDLSHMDKIKKNLIQCPYCGSMELEILAETSITVLFTCKSCNHSYGIKWLTESEVNKMSKAKLKGWVKH